MSDDNLELIQAARCEDLIYSQISDLTVVGDFERKVIDTIKGIGAHLLEGSRGVGKSMLLRQAEIEMDRDFLEHRKLGVYISFKTSTLLEGVTVGQRDAFQAWVGAKILEGLHEKLLTLDLISDENIIDPYHEIFGIKSPKTTKIYLQEKIHNLQKLATASNKEELVHQIGNNFLDKVNDITSLLETVKDISSQFNLSKIVFLFDEAAHTFIPKQQEIFFEIYKLLHGEKIAVKAAVYPSITSYGRNFEIGQDAILVSMDRFDHSIEGRNANRELFRNMLLKRIPQSISLKKKIFSKGHVLDLCTYLSTGNPRAFLHLLNRSLEKAEQLMEGFSERAVILAAQEFVDKELLPYHNNLAKRLPKYSYHVKLGINLLINYLIIELKNKNSSQKKNNDQSAFFTVGRDTSPHLSLALNILCYSGILANKGTIAVPGNKTGNRYMVHLALMVTEKAFSITDVAEAIKLLNVRYTKNFQGNNKEFDKYLSNLKEASEQCVKCSMDLPPSAKFCPECGAKVEMIPIVSALLDEPVDSLSISDKIKARIKSNFPLVRDILDASLDDLKLIPYIKERRSIMIKNAAEEFISG
ncbi:zinc ribbon domain-containing protein [Tolypothrix sp. PCC 7910]|uniref:zinc ribbon domain-containing protein n=1 Tax=Tolypothrix sp. PCC 7910 TaxID=2099387 RepID=UPI001427770E|nr:zinc ribbon domain-containing protein [Tolypothrix sp. PCC 7910]QIR36707.1 zinc ribbon domain-containing protein [Tolypothrix sp. PCC 7910]